MSEVPDEIWVKSRNFIAQSTKDIGKRNFGTVCMEKMFELMQEHQSKNCPCGNFILADTEDMKVPLCHSCHVEHSQQKPRPIETAPIETDILTYGYFYLKGSGVGQRKFVVGSLDDRHRFYHESNEVADYVPISWLPLPVISEGGAY